MKYLTNAFNRILVVTFCFFICNSASAQLIDGSASFVNAKGTTQVDVLSNAQVSFLDAFDQTHINVLGGEINWLTLHNEATANISGGKISWINAYDNSFAKLTGLDDLSWLVFHGADSRVEVVGNNISYSNGHLSGVWANGVPFSFWAVRDYITSSTIPSNIVISSVPEPSTLLFLAVGFPLAFIRARNARLVPLKKHTISN
jgi:hypothetical protein